LGSRESPPVTGMNPAEREALASKSSTRF